MYIKQVAINGFKSYRDATFVEPFSPQHNVVVGRNGSGKSNFFFAIRFVLSDMFSSLRAEDRHQLLHDGGTSVVMAASVEIVFDNADCRIPIEREEVVLKRAIGLKKDEYFLDGKHISKSDVVNLLESSGFSRSNPYYIVQQGKIQSLACAKDPERLHLLKEVAGTNVYDERRAQSVSILEDTKTKKERTEEMLHYIEERLDELEQEKEELKDYQKLDKDRRSIEYAIHNRELDRVRATLDELETQRETENGRAEQRRRNFRASETDLEELEAQVSNLERTLMAMKEEKKELDKERGEHLQAKAKLELDVAELNSNVQDQNLSKENADKHVADVEKEIAKVEEKLAKITPQYQVICEEQANLEASEKEMKYKQTTLLSKQSRGKSFESLEERNQYLKQEIKAVDQALDARKSAIATLSKEIQELKEQLADEEELIEEREEAVEDRTNLIRAKDEEFQQVTEKLRSINIERKELWTEESRLDTNIAQCKDEIHRAEKNVMGRAGRAVSDGLRSVQKIIEEYNIGGTHGPLLNLITGTEGFDTAIEITAGGALFNVVVDNDEIASKILELMNSKKYPGRVTFLPLNRIKPQTTKYPKDRSEAVPLVENVHADPKYKKVLQQIFGRTLVCRTMVVAAKASKAHDLDCITLEGDKVNKKGAISGGFVEGGSRIKSQKILNEGRKKLTDMQREAGKIKQKGETIDQLSSVTNGACTKLKATRKHLRDTHAQELSEIRRLKQSVESNKKELIQKEQSLVSAKAELKRMESTKSSHQTELGSDLSSQLDTDEQDQLTELSAKLASYKKEMVKCLHKREKLETEKNALEQHLENNLKKKLNNLLEMRDGVQLSTQTQDLQIAEDNLESLKTTIKEATERQSELQKKIKLETNNLKEVNEQLENLRAEEREHAAVVQSADKIMDQILSQRSLLLQKRDESMRKIRDLGALPSDAYEMYQTTNEKTLYKKLTKCNKELKKYSHVNKKALDQYISFSEQRDVLKTRKDTQDSADEAILDLIKVLDSQKDEAIERTFKQVAKYFKDVFAELVPGGQGKLIMQTRKDIAENSEEEDQEAEQEAPKPKHARIENYVGVSIRVSFRGKSGETQLIQQLSGGQKTLVALAMIFAIQRCDPAPFYLFDEIDAALDPDYRKAVAEMIHKLSSDAQFVTTTFRPEMLANANKCYGVRYANKVSHINCVSKKEALEFIQDDRKDQV